MAATVRHAWLSANAVVSANSMTTLAGIVFAEPAWAAPRLPFNGDARAHRVRADVQFLLQKRHVRPLP